MSDNLTVMAAGVPLAIDIISIAVTLAAVIVALFIGIRSLKQTEKIQRQNRYDNLLKEIYVWANSIGLLNSIDSPTNATEQYKRMIDKMYEYAIGKEAVLKAYDIEQNFARIEDISNMIGECQKNLVVSGYICDLASIIDKMHGSELFEKANKLSKRLLELAVFNSETLRKTLDSDDKVLSSEDLDQVNTITKDLEKQSRSLLNEIGEILRNS